MTKRSMLFVLIAALCFIEAPVPAAQGGQPTQNVNVVNTPTVIVAGTPTVAIAGTPTVAVAGIAVATVKIFEGSNFQLSDPIDVSAFKQIRIAARCFDPAQGVATVRPFVLVGNNLFEVADIGDLSVPCNSGASATYEVPGQAIVLQVENGPAKVAVFARAN